MDAVDFLPDEVWVRVLQYVPLKDRICHVQYVSKRFYKLSNDSMVMEWLDFEECIFMPESVCLSLLRKGKLYIRYLSFRNCVWFTSSMFAKLPNLSCVVSLDLLGCKLSGSNIYMLLKTASSIKNLSLTINESNLRMFCENTPRPTLQIHVLHIEFFIARERIRPVNSVEYLPDLEHFIAACCQNGPRSLSVFTHEEYINVDGYLGFFPCFQSGEIALNTEFSHILFEHHMTSPGIVAASLRNMNLHGVSQSTTVSALRNVRLISLPYPMVPYPDTITNCHCMNGVLYPSYLPALQYLALAPELLESNFCCYTHLTEGILIDSDLPQLSYLDLGRITMLDITIPVKLYERLHSFINLVELNLEGLSFHLFMLLDSIKDLKHLTGLALCINETIREKLQSKDIANPANSSRVSRVSSQNTSFFIKLAAYFPNLIKLELTHCSSFDEAINASVLRPIGTLKKLDILKLRKFHFSDIVFLGEILGKCTNVSSLTVTPSCAASRSCEYSKFSRYLSCMAGLTDVDIGHPHLLFKFSSIHPDLCSIVTLQRLVIRSNMHLSANMLEQRLRSLFFKCRNLCMCIFISERGHRVPQFVNGVISRVKRDLKAIHVML